MSVFHDENGHPIPVDAPNQGITIRYTGDGMEIDAEHAARGKTLLKIPWSDVDRFRAHVAPCDFP